MIDITDRRHQPDISEIEEYIGNKLFQKLYSFMEENHKALVSVEYSGDNVLLGWNVRFRKSGRTLCRIYPRDGYFSVLIVVGSKEKEHTEKLMPQMSEAMQKIYNGTKEGMGQRWLVFDLDTDNGLYNDFLKLIRIRRESK